MVIFIIYSLIKKNYPFLYVLYFNVPILCCSSKNVCSILKREETTKWRWNNHHLKRKFLLIILNKKLDASLGVTTVLSSSRFDVVYDMLLNNMNTQFISNCLLPVLICIEMIYNTCPLSCCIVQSYNSQELDRCLIFYRLSGIN